MIIGNWKVGAPFVCSRPRVQLNSKTSIPGSYIQAIVNGMMNYVPVKVSNDAIAVWQVEMGGQIE